MKIKSLARQTDLMFKNFEAEIIDRNDYVAVKTASNPRFHWGNYLLFDAPPSQDSYSVWMQLFEKEFPQYKENPSHILFSWNPGIDHTESAIGPFLRKGFVLDQGLVLATDAVQLPQKQNSKITMRPFENDDDWEQAVHLQVAARDPAYNATTHEAFIRQQFMTYRRMTELRLGNRFGAFLGSKLVGDLGVFHKKSLARYQNVATHPEHQRQGICGTLVHFAGEYALKNWRVRKLVMEADALEHAAKIYQSVGFKPVEKNYALVWVAAKNSVM